MATKTPEPARRRVRTRRELAREIARWRRGGQRVVFTSGCFDLLHIGHVRSFEAARELGDILVVGVNRDRRVRELKGAGRPLVGERRRAEMVAALACVERVVLFGENDAGPLIRALRPDIACKGGEYRGERIPEQAAIEDLGGRFVHLRQIPGARTTLLLDRAASGAD
ncbi:MAG: adenylyltransferase/cytidyltransferase family protein [Proteobacteria bacterium]|nr:adenylyltransferase/cytidyltransferase family protein [Pseudomonadota bacterium]